MRGEIRTAILIVLDLVLPAGNNRMSLCIDIYVNGKSSESYTLHRGRRHSEQTTASRPARAGGATLQ